MPNVLPPSSRDPRIDLMRGLSLLSIYVDHIPNNWLAGYSLHNWGFSDAAELFVLLAGFSAMRAYEGVFARQGLRVGLKRVFARCLHIYGVQVLLLLATFLLVGLWERTFGFTSIIMGPMLRDGWHGALRGVSLRALPAYLDILPLYILLLAAFPVVRYGMARSVPATLLASFALWGAANVWHLNLPNVVDPGDAAHWYFNPFAWQLVFVIGCALATMAGRGAAWLTRPPVVIVVLCWAYAVGAFVIMDSWKLWPPPLPGNFYGTSYVLSIFGNEPKTYVSPWRLLDVMAIVLLALTSARMLAVSRRRALHPLVACGRNSLPVFALGCALALVGRLIFRTAGVTVATQVLVNAIGLSALLGLGLLLDARKALARARRAETEMTPDAVRPAE